VNGGVRRGKVISDLRFKFFWEKSRRALLHYIWKLQETINYSVIEAKVVDIINFVNERIVAVKQKVLAHNFSAGDNEKL
jgi:hypothetical protein